MSATSQYSVNGDFGNVTPALETNRAAHWAKIKTNSTAKFKGASRPKRLTMNCSDDNPLVIRFEYANEITNPESTKKKSTNRKLCLTKSAE